MDKYLKEARRVINELGSRIEEARKFQYDNDFLGCLAEEILASVSSFETPIALFEIYDNGEISFVSIVNEAPKNASMVGISLLEFKKGLAVDEKRQHINDQATIVKECLELDLLNKKNALIDKLLGSK